MTEHVQNTFHRLETFQDRIRLPVAVGFHLVLAVLIILNWKPVAKPAKAEVLGLLSQGKLEGFNMLGYEFDIFKKMLPSKGKITFLSDQYPKNNVENAILYQSAQNYLCPLILNPEPHEPLAIASFSSPEIFKQRLEETGYQLVTHLGEGKGILAKKK